MTTRLAPGDTAPAFSLLAADQSVVSLADFGGQRVIVYFYPAAMTPGCTTQAVDFTAAMDELSAAGLRVVGISPDEVSKLAEFGAAQTVAFPLLSDPDKSTLKAYGAYGEKMLYGNDAGVGTIWLAQYNVKASGHVDKLRRELGV
jgi:peroxiredoxin Q/BCP